MDLIKQAWKITTDSSYTKWTAPLQLFADAILCVLIVLKIPYTEIDWIAYMQQIKAYLDGERDYAKIHGDTGPLVYPAMHVYIYRGLYAVTNSGKDIFTAQVIFIGVYLVTLLFAMQCYRQAGVPPYILPLLSLSKRMHSIFLLRLFNDCFAIMFLFMAVYFYQKRLYLFGTLAYSVGLGVKMTLLLALPAIGMVLWQGIGRNRAFHQAQMMGQFQTLIAYPFILGGFFNYLRKAFEFSRVFLFKWTVNWRFLGEERFLGGSFSYLLIGTHLLLLGFFGTSRWLAPSDWSPIEAIEKVFTPPPKEEENRISRRVTPRFVLTAILSSLVIGCLCARSLHYQFFVYIAWSVPLLLWQSMMHPIFIYAICLAQEWAWNVYPSTNASSMVVVGCLAATIGSVWLGTSTFIAANANPPDENVKTHEHAE